MTQDEIIIAMAREAGLKLIEDCCDVPEKFCAADVWKGSLSSFAALVAAHEREKQAEQEPVAWRECAFCGVEHRIKSDGYILDTKTDEVFCRKCYVHTHENPVKQEPVVRRKEQVNELIKESARLIVSISDEGDRYLTAIDTLRNAYRLGLKDAGRVHTKDPCNPLQDLTDDEIEMIFKSHIGKQYDDFARAVITADREKNRG